MSGDSRASVMQRCRLIETRRVMSGAESSEALDVELVLVEAVVDRARLLGEPLDGSERFMASKWSASPQRMRLVAVHATALPTRAWKVVEVEA